MHDGGGALVHAQLLVACEAQDVEGTLVTSRLVTSVYMVVVVTWYFTNIVTFELHLV